MLYLYHSVPKNLQGTVLYPLNLLKEKYPDAYVQHIGKYEGRGHILQQRIPLLDCLWNDVLHFSAVSPIQIKQALLAAGRTEEFSMTCYQIDPKMLDPKNTVVYLYEYQDTKFEMNEKNFSQYNPSEVAKYSNISDATKNYYREMIASGKRPLLFYKIPHILFKGSIDVAKLSIVTV